MNILQIISGRGVNGALVYCKILSEELARRGHRLTLLCRPTSWMKENVDPQQVTIIESSLTRFPFSELKRIAAHVRDQEIDLIHTHMTRGQNFGIGLKLLTGIPVVATAHNRHFEIHWNFNDFVIANSQSTFDYHSRINRIPGSRMETIHCCTDFDRLKHVPASAVAAVRKRLRLRPDDFLIGVIGEVASRKGHRFMVQALPRILAAVPNAKFVFAGRFGRKQAHIRSMRRFIVGHGLAGKIKWVGRQTNIADYMTACALTVVPSLEEPLGLVAIESLMAGTPVIASDTGGLKEIVLPDETGLLVPPADSSAIAESVIKLALDDNLRHLLGRQGQEFVNRKFDANRLINQVESVYHRLLAKRKAA